MTTPTAGFPNEFQTEYARIPKAPLPGDYWEGQLFAGRHDNAVLARVTEVAYASTVTIGAFNATDQVGVTINGVNVAVAATTDAAATAVLLVAAINAATLLSGVITATYGAGAVLTLAGALGADLTVTEYSPSATTATISAVTASVVQPQVAYGYGVALNAPSGVMSGKKIMRPSSLSDSFAGVLVRTQHTDLPAAQIEATSATFNTNYCMPGQAYKIETANCGVMVEYVGTAPVETDSVYWICTGASAGLWRADDGSTAGTSQVSTLTITSVDDGLVGFSYDGLPALTLGATPNATADATSLRGLFVGNAAYAAIGTIVDNGAGTLTITFINDAVHTFADESTGTSAVAEVIDTAAVAAIPATAKLIPGYSWGKPSILAANDSPGRGYLRLNNP